MGRNTRGVRGISLAADDVVIGADVLETDAQVLTVSEEGFGKRNNVDAYKVQLRGGKGVKNFKITPKTGVLVGVEVVRGSQELILITSNGIVIRTDIESIGIKKGRNTSGVKIQRLEENDKVAALIPFPSKATTMNREHCCSVKLDKIYSLLKAHSAEE